MAGGWIDFLWHVRAGRVFARIIHVDMLFQLFAYLLLTICLWLLDDVPPMDASGRGLDLSPVERY